MIISCIIQVEQNLPIVIIIILYSNLIVGLSFDGKKNKRTAAMVDGKRVHIERSHYTVVVSIIQAFMYEVRHELIIQSR